MRNKPIKTSRKPILLIFDIHGSHLTYKTIKEAIYKKIISHYLSSDTSNAIQPFSVGVFATLKYSGEQFWRHYKIGVRKYADETLNSETTVKNFEGWAYCQTF